MNVREIEENLHRLLAEGRLLLTMRECPEDDLNVVLVGTDVDQNDELVLIVSVLTDNELKQWEADGGD